MPVAVRPQTKMMSALLAAGVVAAAAPAWVPLAERAAPAVRTAAVQPASVVSDLLYNFGMVVDGATKIVETPIEAALWSPDYAISTVLIGLRDPAIIGSLLSFVAQQYLNPTYGGFADYGFSGLTEITSVLPPPIGTWLTGALSGAAGGIGSLFDALPDPSAGASAFYDFVNDNFVGNIVDDINWLALAPVYSIADTVSYLGYLPYELEATLESALRNPAEIPGLISNLVRGLVEPYNGLLGRIVDNFVAPLTYLPGIGQVIANVYTAIADGVQNLLDLLPAPVTPTPFQSSAAASTALVSALPSATGAVTLDLPKTAEQLAPTADPDAKKTVPVHDPVDTSPPAGPDPAPVDAEGDASKADVETAEGTVKDTDVKDTDGKGTDGKATDETKPVERSARHRADDKKDASAAGESAGAGQNAAEPKAAEPKAAENKASEQKASEQKASEQKADAAA